MDDFWGVLLRAYKEFEGRVDTLTTEKGNKAHYIRLTIENMIGPFSISDIERARPSVSRDTILLVLRQLRDEAMIVPEGKGRGSKMGEKDKVAGRRPLGCSQAA